MNLKQKGSYLTYRSSTQTSGDARLRIGSFGSSGTTPDSRPAIPGLSVLQLVCEKPMKYATACLMFIFLSLSAIAAEPENPDIAEHETKRLTYSDALILGLVEGITEYLPISSTGHLIITNRLLALDSDAPVVDDSGQPVKVEENGNQRNYTIGEAAYAYAIVIQAGAIAAVCFLYWRTLMAMLMGIFGKNPEGRKLAIYLLAAFIPAAIAGLLLDSWIEAALGNNVIAVAGALITGAFVMLWVERWRRRTHPDTPSVEDDIGFTQLTLGKSVVIGCLQCFALFPGTSRSMATIVGGYVVGLSPARAAEFSFLLGLITLSAASGYKFLSDGPEMMAALHPGPVLIGVLVAFVSAALAIKWLVGYLCKHGLALFAWYRIALAAAIFLLMR